MFNTKKIWVYCDIIFKSPVVPFAILEDKKLRKKVSY